MLNRKTAPISSLPASLDVLESHTHYLSNGLKVQLIEGGTQEVLRITFLFNAGTRYQTKPLVATTTLAMLTEGTKSYSGTELAEQLEYHGAYTDQGLDRDKAGSFALLLKQVCKKTIPAASGANSLPNVSRQRSLKQSRLSVNSS